VESCKFVEIKLLVVVTGSSVLVKRAKVVLYLSSTECWGLLHLVGRWERGERGMFL